MLAPAYQDTCQRNAGGEAIQFVGIWSPISFRPFEEGVNDVDQRFWAKQLSARLVAASAGGKCEILRLGPIQA